MLDSHWLCAEHGDEHDTVERLLSKMTVKEKVSQLSSTAPAIDHLGISAFNFWAGAMSVPWVRQSNACSILTLYEAM